MKLTNIIPALAVLAAVATGCGTVKSSTSGFPEVKQDGKIAIVAHRGFWNCEKGGMSENSIASLKAAQDAKLWGSECDIHLTADGVIIVNHNNDIAGKLISTHNFADFAQDLLPNGERRPNFDEYLDQTARCKTTMLIIELKKQPTEEIETRLVEKTIETLKAHKLYTPDRVAFITFSDYMSKMLAEKCPEFVNQFLTSKRVEENAPANWHAFKVNGIDYRYPVFQKYPEWVKQAHDLGMSVNAWTVDAKADIEEMAALGVDQITSNEPLLVREVLGKNEFKK